MKILIADDERDFVGFLKERLTMKGHAVDKAYDGDEAIEMLKNGGYDMLFVDHNMPEKTGLEITKYVREKNILITVVMVTGYEQMADFFAREIGVDEYIAKPVRIEEIEAIIDKYDK